MVAARAGLRVPLSILALITVSWMLAIVAQLTGSAGLLHHDNLIEGTLPLWAAIIIFVLTWQAMIGAMMLPSSLPLIRLFIIAAANQERSGVIVGAFLAGYAAVWTAFGACAFAGDFMLHRTVDRVAWLSAHAALIPAAVLILAGAFQFSGLKDACLNKCRLPANFLLAHYKRGIRAAFSLGSNHGLFCVGCCWAIMLVGFAAGSANLLWMGMLTAVMVYEKTAKYGAASARFVGIVFVFAGILSALYHLRVF